MLKLTAQQIHKIQLTNVRHIIYNIIINSSTTLASADDEPLLES